jgi:predicted amidohydrolase YtcJ
VIRLFVNATVLTLERAMPVAEAMAVQGDAVVAVGSMNEILTFPEEQSEVLDLRGRTVVPGFVDPHNHFSIAALDVFFADCRDAPDVPEIQSRLAALAKRVPEGAWVRGWGYDERRLTERRHPTRRELDEAVGDRPALLMHFSHHQAVVSSRALARAGIDRATPDPAGGEIARDAAGEPTGLLFERAMSVPETRSREDWEARFVDVARAASLRYAAHGITAIEDAAVTPAMARRYAEARAAGALAIRVGEIMVGSRGWFEPPADAVQDAPLKLFVDGGFRCALRYERDGREVSTGFLFYRRQELAARLLAAWRRGRRVTCHAIGNLGIETAIDAIEDALADHPSGRGLVRIDHAIFLTPDLIRRLADLGIWVVAQPSFLYDAAASATPAPPGLVRRPFRSAADAGILQAFSSDHPCGSLSPLAGIAAAVTRHSRDGGVHDPGEAMGVQAALEAYTISAARAAGADRERGSLAVGKRADFAVLSENPLACAPASLAGLAVVETWVAGERVHPAH